MKKIVLILIGLVFVVLELSIANRISILGTHVNLLMIYVVLLATNVDRETDYLSVVVVGFVYDLLAELIFGINLFWALLMTWLIRLSMDKLYEEKKWSMLIIYATVMFLSVVYDFIINQIFYVPKGIEILTSIMLRNISINAILGILLSIVMRPFFRHIMKNWW